MFHRVCAVQAPRPFFALLITVALASGMLVGTGRAATCPESHASMKNQGTATLVAAIFDSTVDDPLGPYHVSFNLVQGVASMRQPGCLCGAWVEAADAFDVTGVPAGTPVPLTVRFTVDGSIFTLGCGGSGCAGSIDTRLSCGGLVSENFIQRPVFLGSVPVHDERTIALTLTAGSPATILYYLHGQRSVGGEHGTEATGHITFEGLPVGITVVSCQGYSSGAPTPARRTSWGQIKAHYR